MKYVVPITCLLVALISIACSERTYNNKTLLLDQVAANPIQE